MKMKGILLLLCMVFVSMTAWGVPLTEKTASSDHEEKMEIAATASKAMTKAELKEIKKEARLERKIERRQRFFKKIMAKKMDKYGDVDIDFQDPVKKWMCSGFSDGQLDCCCGS